MVGSETITSFDKEIRQEIEKPHNILSSKLEACRVDVSEHIPEPELAWEAYGMDGYQTVGTLGNFSLVKGKAKSKKTFFMTMALAATVSDHSLNKVLKSPLKEKGAKVIYFDTEQSKYHVQKTVKRICQQAKMSVPNNLISYGLRKEKPEERFKLVAHAIETTPNLGFVVIDGIRDLITSINDESESTKMASALLDWSERLNIHILVVLHENPTGEKARGHIGTELTNKAETVITVELDRHNKDISIVNPTSCRNKPFDAFAFEINDNGLPQVVEGFNTSVQSRGNSFSIEGLSEHDKFKILTETFSHGEEFSRSDLISQIKVALNKQYPQHSKGKGENKIKDLITDALNKKWLLQDALRKPYKLGQFLSV